MKRWFNNFLKNINSIMYTTSQLMLLKDSVILSGGLITPTT